MSYDYLLCWSSVPISVFSLLFTDCSMPELGLRVEKPRAHRKQAALHCAVVGKCICYRKREAEIEDRGCGYRERASYVVGGRD